MKTVPSVSGTCGPGQVEFYKSGLLKSGNCPGRHVLRSGKRELIIERGCYAEFDHHGKLEKISTPINSREGPVRFFIGGRIIDVYGAEFAPDLSPISASLSAPAKIMTRSGELLFSAKPVTFHETGSVKSGIFPAGAPLPMKGGAVTPENEVDAEFRADGTLEKLFFPDTPMRRGGKIIRSMAGEKLICAYMVFDPLGWISETYLEYPAVFRAGALNLRIRGKVAFHPGEALREGCLSGEEILLVGGRRKRCSGMIELTKEGKVLRCETMRNVK